MVLCVCCVLRPKDVLSPLGAHDCTSATGMYRAKEVLLQCFGSHISLSEDMNPAGGMMSSGMRWKHWCLEHIVSMLGHRALSFWDSRCAIPLSQPRPRRVDRLMARNSNSPKGEEEPGNSSGSLVPTKAPMNKTKLRRTMFVEAMPLGTEWHGVLAGAQLVMALVSLDSSDVRSGVFEAPLHMYELTEAAGGLYKHIMLCAVGSVHVNVHGCVIGAWMVGGRY